MKSLERLKKEFKEMQCNPLLSLGCTIGFLEEEDNYYKWKATLGGPMDSPYTCGLFTINIIFPEDYPNNRPQIFFVTPIYHININPNNISEPVGSISPSFFNWWKPSNTVRELLSKLYTIFYSANPDSAFGMERANEYLHNKSLYESKVRYFTKKYAGINSNEEIKSGIDWDFSYNEEDLNSINLNEKMESSNQNEESNDNNEDSSNNNIEVILTVDGSKETKIHCNRDEITKNVIQRGLKQLGISDKINKDDLLIFNLKRLNCDISLKDNEIINSSVICMISNFDLE